MIDQDYYRYIVEVTGLGNCDYYGGDCNNECPFTVTRETGAPHCYDHEARLAYAKAHLNDVVVVSTTNVYADIFKQLRA
jgi:hypothetical protein